jgi:hypothetical protein
LDPCAILKAATATLPRVAVLHLHPKETTTMHSTGPKTPEGKQRSSQNARKHGLSAKQFIIQPGDEQAFEDLATQFAEELCPEGILEHSVFTLLVQSQWNLRRCRTLEADLMAQGLDPLLDERLTKTLAQIDRYARRHERLFFQSLKELKALQTARALREQNEPKPEAPLADTKQTQAAKRRTEREQERQIDRTLEAYLSGHLSLEQATTTLRNATSASATNH